MHSRSIAHPRFGIPIREQEFLYHSRSSLHSVGAIGFK
jgi:hypothetical protein